MGLETYCTPALIKSLNWTPALRIDGDAHARKFIKLIGAVAV